MRALVLGEVHLVEQKGYQSALFWAARTWLGRCPQRRLYIPQRTVCAHEIADNTTAGVEANRDSPAFSGASSTTRPLNRRVDVARTVSPLAAPFPGYPCHRLQRAFKVECVFRIRVRAVVFLARHRRIQTLPYFCNTSQSPSAFNSSMML